MKGGRFIFRRISGPIGIIITYGLHEYKRNHNIVMCDDKLPPSSWYPGKYLVDMYSSWVYTPDDLHFLKYYNKEEKKGLMSWPSMENGLQLRIKDEQLLHQVMSEIQASNNQNEVAQLYTRKIEDIIYGKGLTGKDRQDHLLKYGCARYTDEALQLIADSVKDWKYRGIIEIGAGYGQWSRVLHDKYKIDIMAFDSFTNLPSIAYEQSPSNQESINNEFMNKYMYTNIQKGTERVLDRLITEQTHEDFDISRRALMIIYPDPNKMAYNCLVKYCENESLIWNDLLIYVGEGRNGVNADQNFFDTLEGLNEKGRKYQWKLVKTCPLKPFGGHDNKGFERLFIFKRELSKTKQNFTNFVTHLGGAGAGGGAGGGGPSSS